MITRLSDQAEAQARPPPGRVTGVAGAHVGDCGTYYRPQPVGTDEQVAPLLAAVGASGGDSVVVLLNG
jgi:hypothetical protein